MANRRMIGKNIYHSDEFIELSNSAKILYSYFILDADDDGLFNGVKMTMRLTGTEQDAFDELRENGYIMELSKSVYAITHWNLQNRVAPSKRTPTSFPDELKLIQAGDNGIYQFKHAISMQNACNISTQCSIVQCSSGKESLEQESSGKDREVKSSVKRKDGKENQQSVQDDKEEYTAFMNLYEEKILQRPISSKDKLFIAKLIDEYSKKYDTDKYKMLIEDITNNQLNHS